MHQLSVGTEMMGMLGTQKLEPQWEPSLSPSDGELWAAPVALAGEKKKKGAT